MINQHKNYPRLVKAFASFSPEQLWALKVAIMAERKRLTDNKTITYPGDPELPQPSSHMEMAYDWALSIEEHKDVTLP